MQLRPSVRLGALQGKGWIPPTQHRKAHEADADPNQFAKPSQEGERNAGDFAIAEGREQEQIASILRAEATGDEKRASFDEDG